MTDTLDNFLREASNMKRVPHEAQSLMYLLTEVSRIVATHATRMAEVAKRQAAYMTAIDGGTIAHAVINFASKAEQEDVSPITIMDAESVRGMMVTQAKEDAIIIGQYHEKLLAMEALILEIEPRIRNLADAIKAIQNRQET